MDSEDSLGTLEVPFLEQSYTTSAQLGFGTTPGTNMVSCSAWNLAAG